MRGVLDLGLLKSTDRYSRGGVLQSDLSIISPMHAGRTHTRLVLCHVAVYAQELDMTHRISGSGLSLDPFCAWRRAWPSTSSQMSSNLLC